MNDLAPGPIRLLYRRLPAAVVVCRPHQWVKNVLVPLPLVLSHQLDDLAKLLNAALAFLIFSLVSSSAYVLNDLLDVESDRAHPTKRLRPLAAGRLSTRQASVLMFALFLSGATLAVTLLPRDFVAWVALYWVLTLAYSLRLKRVLLADVMVLAGLYCLRLLAGGAACEVLVSHWLLGLSLFLFVSLALVKRYTELRAAHDAGLDGQTIQGRGYMPEDLEILQAAGPASGFLAVLVLALYTHSPDVILLYSRPTVLLLVCPLLMYWITRVWVLAKRRKLDADPVLFALNDRPSWVAGALTVAIVLAAR